MSKEEYAQLCYLLGKLKYSYGEMSIKSNTVFKEFNKLAENIDAITRVCIIDNENKEVYLNAENFVVNKKD
jgi:hypothetical protein